MATYSICAMRSASRSFAIFSSFLLAALRSSFGFDHAQFRSLLFCHLLRHAHIRHHGRWVLGRHREWLRGCQTGRARPLQNDPDSSDCVGRRAHPPI